MLCVISRIKPCRQLSTIHFSRVVVPTCISIRSYSSTKDIAGQQHSGSRSAPKPTKETGTSTQAPHDSPGRSEPPEGSPLPDSHQQTAPEQEDGEPGSKKYMADTEDTQGGELKSNSPFRAAPLEKNIG